MGAGIAGLTLRGKDPATGVQTAMAAAGVSRKEWTRVRGIDRSNYELSDSNYQTENSNPTEPFGRVIGLPVENLARWWPSPVKTGRG